MKTMKKVCSILLSVAVLVCCLSVQPVAAKTVLSKKQVKSKITALKKDIKALEKKNNTAAKIEKKTALLTRYQNALKEKVTINDTEKIAVGKTHKLSWSWTNGGYYNKITWKSGNPSIATVDSNGKVTGKKAGKVTITAKCSLSGKITKKTVQIVNAEQSITVKKDSVTEDGESIIGEYGHITFKLTNISVDDISVTSSDTDVAEVSDVDSKGFYYFGVGSGTTEFTISDGTHSVVVTLTITDEEMDEDDSEDYDDEDDEDYDDDYDDDDDTYEDDDDYDYDDDYDI